MGCCFIRGRSNPSATSRHSSLLPCVPVLLTCALRMMSSAFAGEGEHCGVGSYNAVYLKPAIYALPFWLRFVQCMWQVFTDKSVRVVQALNAVKYITALAVVFTSAAQTWDPNRKDTWFIAWIAALVVKTSYCYYWDVVMDWGLVKFGAGDRSTGGGAMGRVDVDDRSKCCLGMCSKPQVREWRLYPNGVYVAALVFNFFGRISWALVSAAMPFPCYAVYVRPC